MWIYESFWPNALSHSLSADARGGNYLGLVFKNYQQAIAIYVALSSHECLCSIIALTFQSYEAEQFWWMCLIIATTISLCTNQQLLFTCNQQSPTLTWKPCLLYQSFTYLFKLSYLRVLMNLSKLEPMKRISQNRSTFLDKWTLNYSTYRSVSLSAKPDPQEQADSDLIKWLFSSDVSSELLSRDASSQKRLTRR